MAFKRPSNKAIRSMAAKVLRAQPRRPKVRRFFYVASARSTTLHIQFGKTHTEGLTACGRVVSPGWSWWAAHRRPDLKRCTQCDRAA
jgi:hypothetical protein